MKIFLVSSSSWFCSASGYLLSIAEYKEIKVERMSTIGGKKSGERTKDASRVSGFENNIQ